MIFSGVTAVDSLITYRGVAVATNHNNFKTRLIYTLCNIRGLKFQTAKPHLCQSEIETPVGEIQIKCNCKRKRVNTEIHKFLAIDSIMERLDLLERSDSFNDPTMRMSQAKNEGKQIGHEEKMAAVHEEIKKVNQLPAHSTYATHRMRVLNKILQLLSVQRTISQDEELELLFAGLSI
ncbi:hypothetical protein R6Q59_031560 [Mikania micrantha]